MNGNTGLTEGRLPFVEWLRVFLIALVVSQHSAEPYVSTAGDWMVTDPVAPSRGLLWLFLLNGTYFMGLFFLISGYFLDASLARQGAGGVLRSRLLRLGLPLVVFVVFVNGAIGYALYGGGMGYWRFLFGHYLAGGAEFGPLWFIAHLLVYVVAYVGLRSVWPAGRAPGPPGHARILAFTLVLGAATALVRLAYPVDDWVKIFGFLLAEPGRMVQYLGLFAVGTIAGRGQWFSRMDGKVAAVWFAVGSGIFIVMAGLFAQRLASSGEVWLRILWGGLEAFVCVGMILGLLALFRRLLNRPGRWVTLLSGNVYGVFLIHVYVVIGLQMAVLGTGWPALGKFFAVWVGALAISFALSALIRLVPAIRAVV